MSQTEFIPRPSQQKILDTLLNATGPIRLGVSAVPGSGKTHILSYLASELVQRVGDDQEVLVVTLVNAAVDNFRRRVDSFVRAKGLLPGFNYRVCTLHSLAHEIVQQRPSLVGLSQDFDIVDEHTAQLILREVVDQWLAVNFDLLQDYLLPGLNIDPLLRHEIPALALSIAQNFIKRAKDRRLTPHELADAYQQQSRPLPLARLGLDIYREYQSRLARTGVDFDDLIRLAAQALDLDPDFLARLRQRWPYILEDEAQDSSLLQEQILKALAGPTGTWVRVGDPNQAIYETFTTADPAHLRRFLADEGVVSLPMPESGRSSASIIALANYLIDWTMAEHPRLHARNALGLPHITPTPPGDPQPNPPDQPDQIYLRSEKYRPAQEIQVVTRSIKQWLKQNPDKTVAVLDARNKRGVDIANALRRADVPYVELLNSTAATRSTAGVLGNVLKHLAHPADAKQLATLFHVWKRNDWDLEDMQPVFVWIEKNLQTCVRVEDYLWPTPGNDWLAQISESANQNFRELTRKRIGETTNLQENEDISQQGDETPPSVNETSAKEPSSPDLTLPLPNPSATTPPPNHPTTLLREFRDLIRRWQIAAGLPIDQLLLLLAQDLFNQPAELALAHKFAVVLRRLAAERPTDRLPEFVEALAEIARNQRRFLGFDEEQTGFEPPAGKVTVSTMHRAKGLEWDRVYLMGVNNYSFPSGEPQDSYFSEKWFVRDLLNLEAEVLVQLDALTGLEENYVEGVATYQARLDLARERLRLLFVGITRAKQQLIVTWNRGQERAVRPDNQPAIPLVALQERIKAEG